MLCSSVLQRGQRGDVCIVASTLFRYVRRRGDLFVLSCARVRRVDLESDSSVVLILGGMVLMTLLCDLFARYCSTDVCR